MIGQGTIELIEEVECGYVVPPSDYKALAYVIVNKILTDIDGFKQKGINGRRMYETEFMLDRCIDHLDQIINSKKRLT